MNNSAGFGRSGLRSPLKTAVLYAVFAAVSIVANLLAQIIAIKLYSGKQAVLLSLAVGTGVGLLIKYSLDKEFIFRFTPKSLIQDGRTLILYSSTGVLTTAIFWAVELLFDKAFEEPSMRYLGGLIGLTVGYWLKYQADKRFVFGAGGTRIGIALVRNILHRNSSPDR